MMAEKELRAQKGQENINVFKVDCDCEDGAYEAGEHTFKSSMAPSDVKKSLVSGASIEEDDVRIRIPTDSAQSPPMTFFGSSGVHTGTNFTMSDAVTGSA